MVLTKIANKIKAGLQRRADRNNTSGEEDGSDYSTDTISGHTVSSTDTEEEEYEIDVPRPEEGEGGDDLAGGDAVEGESGNGMHE